MVEDSAAILSALIWTLTVYLRGIVRSIEKLDDFRIRNCSTRECEIGLRAAALPPI